MLRTTLMLCLAVPALAIAQVPIALPPDTPAINLTATATAQVDNDRMTIVLQSEAENAQPQVAATEVNAKMARALATAKTVPGISAKTLGYTTNQVFEKGRMVRWRVSQQLWIETADFAAGATLATRLQTDGLLLSSMTFGASAEARKAAIAKLQHEALTDWQSLAKQAAASMGYAAFAPGRLTVNANDRAPPQPRFAAQAMAMSAEAPVAVASGSSEIVVNVSGEAILSGRR